ncbi:13330_t:CDS:2 [Funneliformis geosporum]|uniref:13330_t:CDS:1 n=1 Tax=Funneliformis geosporum TaxID=1117311 RepID=A0A9W4SFE5_9GLOM|nr:13330_t:CDS:2 [Funneliformis geosporum]
MQKASSSKDSDIISLGPKINELEAKVSNLKDELNQIISQPHQSTNNLKIDIIEANPVSLSSDYKHDEVIEEVSHFSLHCSEPNPDESKESG